MRVVGGRLRSRRLAAPPEGVRPTSDRVREALFARLESAAALPEAAVVLDVFAGTGALGIEALSRGASHVTFVERGGRALAVLRSNLVSLGLGAESRVLRAEAVTGLRRLGREGRRFDLVFFDPPYGTGEAGRALEALVEAKLLRPGAVLVVEEAKRHPLPAVAGLAVDDERDYGDTRISFLRPAERADRTRTTLGRRSEEP